ncbi:MAG: hypothetical protein A3F67_01475 [Verrucomicrobia bacterium RIFCSPHIGHO2_12_FULL_41_10]|nr:MAG: hypothetical protein A3F67_01475 [Verrucomicrobia bacterium RIFCSPHIGHO2_12_FULL_41_10]
MMNPSTIEEGTKEAGEALGILGGRTITTEKTVVEGVRAGRSDVVNVIASSNVLRLRGGAPKKIQATRGLKSTGESSEEEELDQEGIDPDLESEANNPMDGEVNKYLKKEIINNIYTECLAKVAQLTLGKRQTAEDGMALNQAEEAEWAAAKESATLAKEYAEREFNNAVRETEKAEKAAEKAQERVMVLTKEPKKEGEIERAIATATLSYEKAREAYADSDYEVKSLKEQWADAKVKTAFANLNAILNRKTQQSVAAIKQINDAVEVEKNLYTILEVAKKELDERGACVRTAQAALATIKNSLSQSSQALQFLTTPSSPVSLVSSEQSQDGDRQKSLQSIVLTKTSEGDKTSLDVKIEIPASEKTHSNEHVTEVLKNAKDAMYSDAEISRFQAEVKEKVVRITEQIEEIERQKQKLNITQRMESFCKAIRGTLKDEEPYLWDNSYACDSIINKLEQSIESWHKFTAILDLGQRERERADLWREAAEKSEAAGEGMIQVINTYISGAKDVAKHLEEEARSAYFLSDSFTYSLKSKEALDKANQMQGENRNLYRNLAAQYQVAVDHVEKAAKEKNYNEDVYLNLVLVGRALNMKADYEVKAIEAREAGKVVLLAGYKVVTETLERAAKIVGSLEYPRKNRRMIYNEEEQNILLCMACNSLQRKAEYQAKASEAGEAGKGVLAGGYREAAETLERAAKQFKDEANIYTLDYTEREKKGRGFGNKLGISLCRVGMMFELAAEYQVKASEAKERGKNTLAVGCREVAQTLEKASEQFKGEGNGGTILELKAEYQARVNEAEEIGKKTLAVGYREGIETLERALGQLIQRSKEESHIVFMSNNKAGENLELKADYQVKASEAREAGKEMLAVGYSRAVEILERAVEQWQQLAEAQAAGEEYSTSSCWYKRKEDICRALKSKVDYEIKAGEAGEAGKEVLAAGYKEVAKTLERAAELLIPATEAHVAGKLRFDWFWYSNKGGMCKIFELKAECQAKMSEAEEAGKRKLAVVYREAAETLERAAELLKQGIEARVEGKSGELFFRWSRSLQSQVNYQLKEVDATRTGKHEIAARYREAAEISQRAVEEHQKSADHLPLWKWILGWSNEGTKGRMLLKEADMIAKKAEEKG